MTDFSFVDAALAQSNGHKPDADVLLRLTPASAIRMDRPRWVWDQRVPVGGTTLMPGREGQGKTALVCWLSARLSRGQLPGEWFGRPADVVYIGHEDDRATVLVPRLVAAGADLDRFHFVDLIGDGTFALTVDVDPLIERLHNRPVALVVVDPLDSHLGTIDSHKKAEVQATIAKLARLAQELRCGALGLAHFNKAAISDLLNKVVGSVGFTTATRSVLAVGDHPDDDTEQVCVVAKANMTDRTAVPAIRFRVEGASVPHPDDGGTINTARVVILGEQVGIDPNSLLVGGAEDRSQLDEAVDWLDSVLSDGPMARSDIARAARAEGISDRTLKRASQRLKVVIERDEATRGRPSTWRRSDYGPGITGQMDVARNHGASDQEKHAESGITGHVSESGPKPPAEDRFPTMVDLPCMTCGAQGRSRVSGLCHDCREQREQRDRAAAAEWST